MGSQMDRETGIGVCCEHVENSNVWAGSHLAVTSY